MKKRIDLLLLERKIVKTRSKAQAMVMAGQVFVNKKKVIKNGETFEHDSNISITNLHPFWVSRGSLKLLHAIKFFNMEVDNLVCMDIGASTGGFTQVLLENNAKKIYSIDVGYNQMHEKLRNNPKIVILEKTNARNIELNLISERIDLIVCDTSFISIKKVLRKSLSLLKNNEGKVIALIKPQFEANKTEIKKGGVVKDSQVHKRICLEIEKWFIEECNMKVKGITQSPLKGPKGNIEYFIMAEK